MNAGTANDLTLTAGGPLLLGANDVTGATVSLNASGLISQTTGVITAATLNIAANGAVTLASANRIANLGTFDNQQAGAVAITDATTLTLTSAIDAGTGNDLTLTTTGAGHGIALNGNAITGNTVTLASAGLVSDTTAGIVTASDPRRHREWRRHAGRH